MIFSKKKDKKFNKSRVFKAVFNNDKTILINVDRIFLMELKGNELKIFYSDEFSNLMHFDEEAEANRFFQDIEALLVN